MSRRKLVAWVGNTDLRASRGELRGALGPIGQAASDRRFDEIHLLSDYDKAATSAFASWLTEESGITPKVWPVKLTGPTRFDEIYEAASKVLESLRPNGRKSHVLTLHLSPGTPAMAAVWILLAKTKFPAELKLWDVGRIVALALALSFLVTIFPARRAARLDPVEALRYE